MAPEMLQTLKALSKSTIFENHQEQSLGRENISGLGHQCPAAFVSHYPQFILPIHKNKDCFKELRLIIPDDFIHSNPLRACTEHGTRDAADTQGTY